MGLFEPSAPKRVVADLTADIGLEPDIIRAPIRLAETHRKTATLFAHLCFVFEDLAFVVPDTIGSNSDLRRQLRQLLFDTQIMLTELAHAQSASRPAVYYRSERGARPCRTRSALLRIPLLPPRKPVRPHPRVTPSRWLGHDACALPCGDVLTSESHDDPGLS